MTEGRDFRFGFNVRTIRSRDSLRAKCHTAERYGYDVVLLPDHLGRNRPAPFPMLVAAATVTERLRVGTLVLNVGFWNPSLLAREAATTDQLTGGRCVHEPYMEEFGPVIEALRR